MTIVLIMDSTAVLDVLGCSIIIVISLHCVALFPYFF
jgi:hypothetical protein